MEITINNLYSQISKERKKLLSLNDLNKLNILDPTSKLKKDNVAGAYLHWIISDYFNRYKNVSIEKYISEVKDDLPLLLKKYNNYRNKELISSPDIAQYTYKTLTNELKDLEDTYGIEVYHTPLLNKDYIIITKNKDYEVYEALTAEGIVFLGDFTSWCIAKRKSFFADTKYRKDQGGKTFVIKDLNKLNSNPKYPDKNEYYCITILPNGEIDEFVNANNDSLSYTDEEDKILDDIKKYL